MTAAAQPVSRLRFPVLTKEERKERAARIDDIRLMLSFLEQNDSIELPYELSRDFSISFLTEIDAFRHTVKALGGSPEIDQERGAVRAQMEFGNILLTTTLPAQLVCDRAEIDIKGSAWVWKQRSNDEQD